MRIAAHTAVYANPDEKVGVTDGAVVGFVGGGGELVALRVEELDDRGGYSTTRTEVTVAAPRKALRRVPCPARATAAELGLISEHLELRWRDGTRAGWTHTSSAVEAAAASSERVEIEGQSHVCFDYRVGPHLTVRVCGSCARLREVNVGGPGLGAVAIARPCAD